MRKQRRRDVRRETKRCWCGAFRLFGACQCLSDREDVVESGAPAASRLVHRRFAGTGQRPVDRPASGGRASIDERAQAAVNEREMNAIRFVAPRTPFALVFGETMRDDQTFRW
jgi:hypothetical protein